MARKRPLRRARPPRRTAPAGAGARTPDADADSFLTQLARRDQSGAALRALHERAMAAAGGSASLLFAYAPQAGRLEAISGAGVDLRRSPPWTLAPDDARLLDRVFSKRSPLLVADTGRDAPALFTQLGGAPAAMLAPIEIGGQRSGVLAVGVQSAPAHPDGVARVADAFAVALELVRHRRQEDLQRHVRELLDEFSATLAATLDIAAGFAIVCHRANRLFGARRASIWILERSAERLALRASSDHSQPERGRSVSATDLSAPAAAAMRRSRSATLPTGAGTRTLMVPLRGQRRALGALVIEDVRVGAEHESGLTEQGDELGRQLSAAVDSLQLLDEVLGSRRELQNLFDSMPNLIAVCDEAGRIVHVNEAFVSRLATSRDRLRGRPLADCVGPELGAWLLRLRTAPPSADAPASCEVIDPVLNGPFQISATERLDRDRRAAGLVLIARDLAPAVRLDAEREAARQQLTRSEKLTALGQFVAGIAHELNNPLQGVLGHVELLRASHALPPPVRAAIGTVYREADRAAKIVRNLLVFTGSRRISRRPLNLHSVLQGVVGLRQAPCHAREIELVRHYAERAPRVHGDPLLLHQVFLNIVMNAEDAIAAGRRPGRIEIGTVAAGRTVITTIRDTGKGFRTEALARLFEPFYTTKDVGQGTGLGLAIAYGIVQEHGGAISAANHPDGGAVMTVELPAAPARRTPRDNR